MITLLPKVSRIKCGKRLHLTDGRTVDVKDATTALKEAVFDGKVVGFVKRQALADSKSHWQYQLLDEELWCVAYDSKSLVRTAEALLRAWESKHKENN